jgi:hypothetical protein
MKAKYVQFKDDEAVGMLAELAAQDLRSEGNTVVTLIRREYESRKAAKERPQYPAVTSYPPVIVSEESENSS